MLERLIGIFGTMFYCGTATAEPISYALLGNKGLLYVKVFKDSSLGHNHAMKAVGWSGKATIDSANLSTCSISITVPVNNLQVDQLAVRKIAGFDGDMSDGDRKKIKINMLSKNQLWADKYRNIRFESTSCEGSGETITLKGKFTLRGVTNNVSIPVQLKADDQELSLKGMMSLKATSYGFEPYSLFGVVGNKDEMSIHFDLKGVPKSN